MHKKAGVLLLALLLLTSFALAQTTPPSGTGTNPVEIGEPIPEPRDTESQDDLKTAADEAGTVADKGIDRVAAVTDPIFVTELTLPEWLKSLITSLLKIEEPITLAKLLVTVMVGILMFIALHNIISLFSSFEDATNMAIAGLLTVFMGILSILWYLAFLLLGAGDLIVGVREWKTGWLITLIIAVILIVIVLKKISYERKKHDKILNAKMKGLKVGAKAAAAAATVDAFAKVTDKVARAKGGSSKGSGGDWTFGRADDD